MGNIKDICINCKTKPVFIQKRRLCKECYRLFYNNKLLQPLKNTRIYHVSEIEFIKTFFKHQNWIYHPAIFRLNGVNYEPDFYDGERNIFIEVSATRQAFYANFEKYKLFIKTYPNIQFEVRDEQGHIKPLIKKQYERKSQQEEVEALQTA